MDLSIPQDAYDSSSEDVPSEEDVESFQNQGKYSETAALVTANPLANVKADFESQKADFESLMADFKSHLDSPKTKADFESQIDSETAALATADPLANLKADFESLKADFESHLRSQKANFKSQLDSETAAIVTADQLANLKADVEIQKVDFNSQLDSQRANFKRQLDRETVTADQLANLKADFESQLECLQKSSRAPLGRSSTIQLEKEGRKQLHPDTFSFLVCSKIWSQPFLLGISVFLFQITIFSLLTADLINRIDAGNDALDFFYIVNDNPLVIPANVKKLFQQHSFSQ
jgi:F0F1-type ATP synthase membrane subunit b/b'